MTFEQAGVQPVRTFAERIADDTVDITDMSSERSDSSGDTASPDVSSPDVSIAGRSVGGQGLERLRLHLMMVGGYPELFTRTFDRIWSTASGDGDFEQTLGWCMLESQRVLRGDIVERAVYKDIPQTLGVGNPVMLERLLYMLAGQVTGSLSPSTVSRGLGVTQPTLDRYLSYQERAYLVFMLTNYSGSGAKVQRRGRKLYFVDGAVCNAALQRGFAPLKDPMEQASLLENLVVSAVKALAMYAGVRLHYWRDGKFNVDLIYVAISPDRVDSGIGMLPLDYFLLAVGTQARKSMLTRLGVTECP